MPELDANMDARSSDVSETLDETVNTEADAEVIDDGGAKSSDAQDGAVEQSTLDIVRDVVKDDEDDEEDAPAADASTETPQEGEESEQVADEDDEGFSDVPFNQHPRFKQLLRQRDVYRTDAQEYRKITDFMKASSLSGEDAAQGFQIMAAMKTDPIKAWELLKPHVQAVLVAAGEVLPAELEQRVQTGEISREAAMSWNRDRARAGSFETQQSHLRQQSERQAQEARAMEIQNTAAQWERDRQLRDPRFGEKLEPLKREIAYLQATEGRPTTPEGVRAQLQKAYDAVKLPEASAPKTAPQAKKPVIGGSVSNANAKPEARSTLDIIDQVEAEALA